MGDGLIGSAGGIRVVRGAREVVAGDDFGGGEGARLDDVGIVVGVILGVPAAAQGDVGIVNAGINDGNDDALAIEAQVLPHLRRADDRHTAAQVGHVLWGAMDAHDAREGADGIDLFQGHLGQETVVDGGVIGNYLHAQSFEFGLDLGLGGFQAGDIALDGAGGHGLPGGALFGVVGSQGFLVQLNDEHGGAAGCLIFQRMGKIPILPHKFFGAHGFGGREFLCREFLRMGRHLPFRRRELRLSARLRGVDDRSGGPGSRGGGRERGLLRRRRHRQRS
ncbi:MAG: hypothetical protein BWY25_00596 [Chloroflexi bacterium ADurb.Bin222]|nr:MAG: hypothetical protein BWY25_00596 [Chloroflexi bacterium ADurb.Bin222]